MRLAAWIHATEFWTLDCGTPGWHGPQRAQVCETYQQQTTALQHETVQKKRKTGQTTTKAIDETGVDKG